VPSVVTEISTLPGRVIGAGQERIDTRREARFSGLPCAVVVQVCVDQSRDARGQQLTEVVPAAIARPFSPTSQQTKSKTIIQGRTTLRAARRIRAIADILSAWVSTIR